jgi:hypothetical protein
VPSLGVTHPSGSQFYVQAADGDCEFESESDNPLRDVEIPRYVLLGIIVTALVGATVMAGGIWILA